MGLISCDINAKPARGKGLAENWPSVCIIGLVVWCVGCGSALTRRSAPNPLRSFKIRGDRYGRLSRKPHLPHATSKQPGLAAPSISNATKIRHSQ